MSRLTDISEQLEGLPRSEVKAIVALIDLKTEDDMDKVLTRLDALAKQFDSRLDALDQKFDSRLDALDQKFDARLDALDQKFDAKLYALNDSIRSIRWWNATVIGFCALLVAALKFLS